MGIVLRLSMRNLAASRLRVALTTFAVLLGVSFVVASFVLTDGLLDTFDTIIEEANAEVDAEVRARSDFDEVQFTARPIDEALVGVVRAVDGVAAAEPATQSMKIVPVRADGEPIRTTGAPILSFNWSDSPLDPLTLVEGRAPAGPGQFVIDQGTADREGFVVGGTYDVIGAAGREPFQLVGLSRFGDANSLGGAILVSYTLDELQRLDGSEGLIQWIAVGAEAGVEPDVLVERLEAALPDDVEAVTGEVVVQEGQDAFSGFIRIFGNILLGFALVAVFVSTFIIANTFNILLSQRVRQLGLLRALGASSRQVRASALVEALIVGLVASVLGLGFGVLLAFGLRAIMDALGFGLPAIDVVMSARTVVVAVAVGVGVTLAASLIPARRAASVPPVAALRSGYRFGAGEGARRTTFGLGLGVLGAVGMGVGLFGGIDETVLLLVCVAGGAVLVFVALSMLAPLFSSPSASALGAPLEHLPGRRITGHMARGNAARNNVRTASTATGLMIGLALIAMATVVADSLKASVRAELSSTLTADLVVSQSFGGNFSSELVGELDAIPGLAQVAPLRFGVVRIDGTETGFTATDLTQLTEVFDIDVREGDPASVADAGHVIVTRDTATDRGLGVGDPLTVEFAATGVQTLTVGAIYTNDFILGDYVIDLSAWDANVDSRDDGMIVATLAPGAEIAATDAAVAALADTFPNLEFETRDEFRERFEGELDSLLVIINVFLGLAIVIALLGITNTMALSVLERTREIGLMRAVGMTRRQTRSLIRLEAGVVSLFGALLGVVVGLVFGWLAVVAIPESAIDRLSLPVAPLVWYVVAATAAGLVAASFPARRAARLDVLDAIAQG